MSKVFRSQWAFPLFFTSLGLGLPQGSQPFNPPSPGIYFSPDDTPLTLPSSPFSGADNSNLTARDTVDPGIYICSGPKWTGTCFWQDIPPSMYGQCGAVTALSGWDSFGPDKGIAVEIFLDISCSKGSVKKDIVWPGIDDLKGQNFIQNGVSNYFGVKTLKYTGAYIG